MSPKILAVAALTVTAAACEGGSMGGGPSATLTPPKELGRAAPYSMSDMRGALLKTSDLPDSAPAKQQKPINTDLGDRSSQQPPGITFHPKKCLGAGILAGLSAPSDLHGPSRVFPNRAFAPNSRRTLKTDGMISTAVIGTVVDLPKVEDQVKKCDGAKVTLTGGATGTLSMQAEPTASNTLTVKQSVTWNGNVPDAAQNAAGLLDADTTYTTQGKVTLWVATAGNTGVSSTDLAPAATKRAKSALK